MKLGEEFQFHGGKPDMMDKQGFILRLKLWLDAGTLSHERAARQIAEFVHYGQTRRHSSLPYMVHVMEVHNGPETYPHLGHIYTPHQRMLALCHDVLEYKFKDDASQDWTPDDFRYLGFSEDFLSDMDACTRRNTETYGEYVMRLSHHPRVRPVKIFDNLSNMFDDPGPVQAARYEVSLPYLNAVEDGRIRPGHDIEHFAVSVGQHGNFVMGMKSRPIATGMQAAIA